MNETPYNFSYNPSLMKQASIVAGSVVGICLIVVAALYFTIIRPPSATVYPVQITIENGQGAQSIARELLGAGIVRSESIAQHLIVSEGGERKIQAGLYIFSKPLNIFAVARKIVKGDYGYVPVKITIPEGSNSKKIAEIVNSKFPDIATSTFEQFAVEKEGYLFPETYFFYPKATSTEILLRIEKQFNKTIANPSLTAEIERASTTLGMNLNQILTVASILEEEVQTTEDRKIVADLIYRRIKLGMPLQVDATLAYVTGKTSAELTLKDLRSDNPYNTYTNKGLPPTPISNPGLDAIEAALNPTPNDYLFYLSDKDGITHFSKTHEEHVKLKAKYLR